MEHERPPEIPAGTRTVKDPIRGMALEPIVPSDEASGELTGSTRRTRVSVAAAARKLLSVSVMTSTLRLRQVDP